MPYETYQILEELIKDFREVYKEIKYNDIRIHTIYRMLIFLIYIKRTYVRNRGTRKIIKSFWDRFHNTRPRLDGSTETCILYDIDVFLQYVIYDMNNGWIRFDEI